MAKDHWSPAYYFDLEGIESKALFDQSEHVWEILEKLEGYVESFSKGAILSPIPQGAYLENKEAIYIGEDVTIEPGALIKGPCIIHSGSIISHGALVRPYSIIEQGAVVGHCSEIKGSLLLPGAKMPHFNYVGDSIIGRDVNLGAGLICANVRLDKANIELTAGGESYSTGRKKFGAIIGDKSSLSCNVVINPGTLIPPKSAVISRMKPKMIQGKL